MTLDALAPTELTERQEKILALVVREYTNKPEPVGSKYLADHFMTNISSATIRNDLSALEEKGYLAAPHTSAGRVPTEAGVRRIATSRSGCSLLSPRWLVPRVEQRW